MQVWFWIWLVVILKAPMIWIGVIIYRAVKDVPDQMIGDDDGGSGVTYVQGPRKRGPNDGRTPWRRPPRRGDSGHEEAAKERRPQHVLRGE
jgi:hypothetical protein